MENQENRIGKDFNIFELARFGLPAFLTNVCSQIFRSLDDGLFISRYVGEDALAALNLLNPIYGVLFSITHLFSLGASNISAKLMGENKQLEAKRIFSRVVISGFITGIIFAFLVNAFSSPLLKLLGAQQQHCYYALKQIRIVYLFAPITIVNQIFSCYYSTAGKPKMGLICSIVNGVVNIFLDIILIVLNDNGVVGACIATVCGDLMVFIIGVNFYFNKTNEIYFVFPEGKYLSTSLESAKYALPQFINALSFSATSLLSNIIILKYIGSSGVAVNAIVSDIRKILTSGLIGFAACMGPVVAYNYGSKNVQRLKKILINISIIWFVFSIILIMSGLILRTPLINIFMSEKSTVEFFALAKQALTIEIFGTIFISGCITLSRMFIALSIPRFATILSIFRNLVIKVIMYLVCPIILGEIGIWISQPLSEMIAFIFGLILIFINREILLPKDKQEM